MGHEQDASEDQSEQQDFHGHSVLGASKTRQRVIRRSVEDSDS
jgi:hypothetical protein